MENLKFVLSKKMSLYFGAVEGINTVGTSWNGGTDSCLYVDVPNIRVITIGIAVGNDIEYKDFVYTGTEELTEVSNENYDILYSYYKKM